MFQIESPKENGNAFQDSSTVLVLVHERTVNHVYLSLILSLSNQKLVVSPAVNQVVRNLMGRLLRIDLNGALVR